MAKNLILWLIIAAVLVTVMNNFSSPSEPQTLNYSEFIEQVKEGKVERVTVDGFFITGKRSASPSTASSSPASAAMASPSRPFVRPFRTVA